MSGNKSTAGNPARQKKVKSAHLWTLFTQIWRRGRDSNPRGIAPKLISSQPRYDHFDTSPCLSQHLTPEKHLGFWGELMGRTYMIFGFRSLRKPSKIKGSGPRRVHKGHTISSQARYDHFDNSPYSVFLRGRRRGRRSPPPSAAIITSRTSCWRRPSPDRSGPCRSRWCPWEAGHPRQEAPCGAASGWRSYRSPHARS